MFINNVIVNIVRFKDDYAQYWTEYCPRYGKAQCPPKPSPSHFSLNHTAICIIICSIIYYLPFVNCGAVLYATILKGLISFITFNFTSGDLCYSKTGTIIDYSTFVDIYGGHMARYSGFQGLVTSYEQRRGALTRRLIARASQYYFQIDSAIMCGAGIYPNDTVVIDRALHPRDGDVVLLIMEGNFAIRRYRRIGGHITLTTEEETESHQSLECELDEVTLYGVVTAVIHYLREG